MQDKTSPLTPDVQVQQSAEYFISMNNEAPSVVAVRVNNPNLSPLRING
jgi:hypothetical protein